jgi:hypothetical protein
MGVEEGGKRWNGHAVDELLDGEMREGPVGFGGEGDPGLDERVELCTLVSGRSAVGAEGRLRW